MGGSPGFNKIFNPKQAPENNLTHDESFPLFIQKRLKPPPQRTIVAGQFKKGNDKSLRHVIIDVSCAIHAIIRNNSSIYAEIFTKTNDKSALSSNLSLLVDRLVDYYHPILVQGQLYVILVVDGVVDGSVKPAGLKRSRDRLKRLNTNVLTYLKSMLN